MENQNYADVMGTGTGSTNAPFTASLLPQGSTIPLYHGYGADGRRINGCSAGCYVALVSGSDQGVSDGYSCCLNAPTLMDSFATHGITWQAYCEAGCPRGNDHFPFTGFASTAKSPNIFTSSSVSTSTFIAAANSANPPSLLWYTPTDNHNMHDNSIQTGDAYLQSFLVGTGTVTNPATGSLLASNLFQAGQRTLLVLWWDEYDPAPILFYGPMTKQPFISISNSFDHYSTLRMLEDNWGLSTLTPNDVAATGLAAEIIRTTISPPLTASFSYLPSTPFVDTAVNFTGNASGGKTPYTYTWSFGDGASSTGQTPSHAFPISGTFTLSLSVTDSVKTSVQSSRSINILPVGALTASFSDNPALPVSGQTVTFTDTASGGTSPYADSWNLGGTNKTGNPVSQSFKNGTYTISLAVSDSTGKTFTTSQLLTVLPNSTGTSSVPVLIGWGGIRLDEASVNGINQPSTITSSAVFPGESATSMELLLVQLRARGYNTVRVDFDPYCTDQTDQNYMSAYNATNLQRAIQIAQYYGFWIVIDYHGNTDLTGGPSCWLNFWAPVIQQFKSSYSQIIWEPLNEPNGTSVSTLSSDYQMWINQDRNQGDNHWIVIQNICSYDCNLCPEGDGSCSAAVYGYPTVTDPLGTLAQGGRIFISLHSYMDYSGYSSSWNNATAESVANGYYATVLAGVAQTGWPALNTEGGTDPLCSGICTPDTNLSGSAAYTTTTLHFIQTLTSLYDNAPQRISWVWWPAGSWTDTTNAGIYGTMQCASRPVGWGCLLNIKPVNNLQPLTANFSRTPLNPLVGTITTFNATASNGTAPLTFAWAFGDGSTGIGSTVTHAYSSAGTFTVVLTAKDSGSLQQTATSQQALPVTSPPPPLTTSFSYSPLSPEAGQQVAFTASASGGATLCAFSWSFGDGSVTTGNPSLHTFTSSGSYNVMVTVTDANGSAANSSQAITVAAVPTVSFTYGPMSPETSSPVTFNARTTGGVGSFAFSWSFGDGNLSVINPASHTYSTPGSFTVTLTATDSDGVNASSSQVIIVAPALSVGFTNSPTNPEADQPVTFTETQSGGVGNVSLSWDFGDNSSSTENLTAHTYRTSGSFLVSVTVTDADGVSTTSTQTVNVVASLGAGLTFSPSSPHAGDNIIFVASATGGVQPYNYSWSFGDSTIGSGSPVSHIYLSDGSYTVILTVTDANNQTASATETLAVKHQDKSCHANGDCTGYAAQTLDFSAIASSGNALYIFTWIFAYFYNPPALGREIGLASILAWKSLLHRR
ncbi:MAG TPA: PKD domain-containing protein [Candidatus Dormibacteraeota bacterium]|nr:PKD domain-containing protein [Candidatus Dormibacteraeota bacterium]